MDESEQGTVLIDGASPDAVQPTLYGAVGATEDSDAVTVTPRVSPYYTPFRVIGAMLMISVSVIVGLNLASRVPQSFNDAAVTQSTASLATTSSTAYDCFRAYCGIEMAALIVHSNQKGQVAAHDISLSLFTACMADADYDKMQASQCFSSPNKIDALMSEKLNVHYCAIANGCIAGELPPNVSYRSFVKGSNLSVKNGDLFQYKEYASDEMDTRTGLFKMFGATIECWHIWFCSDVDDNDDGDDSDDTDSSDDETVAPTSAPVSNSTAV